MTALVSVIMAVHNCGKYVSRAIDSLLNQTFKDFEFIIVDDASNDRTTDIVKSYRDPRIIYLYNEKKFGQTISLNKAIMLSSGKYLARMDGDDICFPDRLLLQVQLMERRCDIGVLGSWVEPIDENDKPRGILRYPIISNFTHLLFSNLLNRPCIAHPTTIIRREVFDEMGLYNEKYQVQDYELWLRISERYKIKNLPRVLLRYRMHPEAHSQKSREVVRGDVADIISSNIKRHMPKLKPNEQDALLNLLLCKRQKDKNNGNTVLEILDAFCQRISASAKNEGHGISSKRAAHINDFAKLFYLPKLAVTNRKLAAQTFLRMFPKYHRWVLSVRYLKTIRRIFVNT